MDRRTFLSAMTTGLLPAPLAAGAQQARAYRVGPSSKAACIFQTVDGLREGLRELGLEEASRSSSGRGAKLGAEVRVRSTGYGLALFFFMLTQPTRKIDTSGQLPSHP